MNVLRMSSRWRRAAVVLGATLGVVLGAGGVAVASTAPTGFVVRAGDLVLSSTAGRYSGTMPVAVRNTSRQPVTDAILALTVPAGLRFLATTPAGPCLVQSDGWSCELPPFAAGERQTVTISFGSYAGPEHFARITASGTVTVASRASAPDARASDRYAAVLRSVSGSVRNPRPYTPSTAYDLALSAGGGPVVTRDAFGVNVRLPLVALDRTDAINEGAFVGVTVDGVDTTVFPSVDPTEACTQVCPVPGEDWMAKGEVRSFALLFTLPAETAAGTYLARVHGDLSSRLASPVTDLTPQDNTVVFTVVVPAA